MAQNNLIDVKENFIYRLDHELLAILLKDRSSGKNIIWATDNYAHRGSGFQRSDQITILAITGRNGNVVKPRVEKSKKEQAERIRDKGEVFTPAWICNKQNNLVDNAWFDRENIFNIEREKTWEATSEPIAFHMAKGKAWEDYVSENRLEIACGEAPYLVSRYDAVDGFAIPIGQRIGLLDRKLRVVGENVNGEADWLKWAIIAFQSIYGYEWQGDNVLLARENLLFTFIDYYKDRLHDEPPKEALLEIAEILSWNIWQMDGLKFVIPESCIEVETEQIFLDGFEMETHICEGCAKNDPMLHTGIYCKIKDWKANKTVKFVSLLKKGMMGVRHDRTGRS